MTRRERLYGKTMHEMAGNIYERRKRGLRGGYEFKVAQERFGKEPFIAFCVPLKHSTTKGVTMTLNEMIEAEPTPAPEPEAKPKGMIMEITTKMVEKGKYEITREDGKVFHVVKGKIADGWIVEDQETLGVDGAKTLEVAKADIQHGWTKLTKFKEAPAKAETEPEAGNDDSYWRRGTKAPDNNGVYLLKSGFFARYENGIWYRPQPSREKAMTVTMPAGMQSPQYRTKEEHKWKPIAAAPDLTTIKARVNAATSMDDIQAIFMDVFKGKGEMTLPEKGGFIYTIIRTDADMEHMPSKEHEVYVPAAEEKAFLAEYEKPKTVGKWRYSSRFERVVGRKPKNVQKWTD
jgi:hypothetical protein